MGSIEFIKEFAAVINTALLVSFMLIFLKLYSSYQSVRQAEINLLYEKNEALKLFTVENANKQITNLKEWHQESMRQLEIEKEKALITQKIEFQNIIENEIKLRNELNEKLKTTPKELSYISEPGIEQFVGEYFVVGKSPGEINNNDSYHGNLLIEIIEGEITATWEIAGKQKFSGVGLLHGDQLSIYYYLKDKPNEFHGVISYMILSSSILRGKWIVKGSFGLPGYEECRRIN